MCDTIFWDHNEGGKPELYKVNAVKLGYNDHGYNKHTVITNKMN